MCWLARGECSRLLGRGGGCGPSPTCPRVVRTDPKRRVHGTPKKVNFSSSAHIRFVFLTISPIRLYVNPWWRALPLSPQGDPQPPPPQRNFSSKRRIFVSGDSLQFFFQNFSQNLPKSTQNFMYGSKRPLVRCPHLPRGGGGVNPPHQAFLHSPAPVDVGQKSLFRLPNPHPISHPHGTLITATGGAQWVHTGRCRR